VPLAEERVGLAQHLDLFNDMVEAAVKFHGLPGFGLEETEPVWRVSRPALQSCHPWIGCRVLGLTQDPPELFGNEPFGRVLWSEPKEATFHQLAKSLVELWRHAEKHCRFWRASLDREPREPHRARARFKTRPPPLPFAHWGCHSGPIY